MKTGNTDGATFASVLAYWGPNLPRFVRHAIRYCHPWYPAYDLTFTRALLGDGSGADAQGGIELADELLSLNRHDDLAAALVSLGGATVGDIMDHGRSTILHRLRSISAYELASALVCSTRPGVHWLDRRLPKTPSPAYQGQLELPDSAPGRSPDESVDHAVLRLIGTAEDGLSSAELMDRLGLPRGDIRGSLGRLRSREIVHKKGTTNRVRYVRSGEEENAAR